MTTSCGDIGLFSRMMLDVETVYMSVDSRQRFSEMLNFLQNAAGTGYDVSTDDVIQRPDAVTVSTVHKMKGLEFPCVFIVDVEARRFPRPRSSYDGWLPRGVMTPAINRGAYQSTHDEEIRLFYTAATRAETYLYVSGAENPAAGKKQWQSIAVCATSRHTSRSRPRPHQPAERACASQTSAENRGCRLSDKLHRNQVLPPLPEKLSVPGEVRS